MGSDPAQRIGLRVEMQAVLHHITKIYRPMKKHHLPALLLLLLSFSCFAQDNIINLRSVMQKSDMIIDIDDYRIDTVWVNDFTYKTYIKMDKIDSTNARILRNRFSAVPKKLILRKYTDGEDFYSDLITNGGGCVMRSRESDINYYNLFFIKKDKNEYRILMHLDGLKWEQREIYRKQIEMLGNFENTKNKKERFSKTLDWFIENGLMPDGDFIAYYKQTGITTDSIPYSERQYQRALQMFQQNGKVNLLPILRMKYPEEVKQYYVQKMENILKQDEPDYYKFYRAFLDLTEDKLTSDDADYILNNSLCEERSFSKYNKNRIMEHLVQVAKEWKN